MAMTVGTPIIGTYVSPASTSASATITSPAASDYYIAILSLLSSTTATPSISGVTGMTWTSIGDAISSNGRVSAWLGTGGTATGTATASWGSQNRNGQLRIIPVTGVTSMSIAVAMASVNANLATTLSLDGPSQTPAVGDLVVSWGRNTANGLMVHSFTPSGWTDHGNTINTDTVTSAHTVAGSTAAHKTTATNNHASSRQLILAQFVLRPTVAGGDITGTVDATRAAHTAAIAGTVLAPVTGTLAATRAPHTAAIAGDTTAPTFTGDLVATRAPHTAVVEATVTNPGTFTGTVDATGPAHTAAIAGDVSIPSSTGTIDATRAPHQAAIAGDVLGSGDSTGVIDATRAPHQASIAGIVTDWHFDPWTEDVYGATVLPLVTSGSFDYIPPLAELPPEVLTERTIMRRSVTVPDLSAYPKDPLTGQPVVPPEDYAEWEAAAVVEEVGVPHVIFPDIDDVNDMTYYRGLPIQGLRFLRREPFGDADADAVIPGITSMDIHPDDSGAPTPFTRARANMEFVLRKSDGTQRRLWSGNVFTRSLGNDGRRRTMSLHALGSLYMARETLVRPVVSDVPLDCGYLIHRALGLVTAKRYVPPPTVATGILSNERGAWSDSPLGFVTDLLAKMWTLDGNQWTVAKIPGSRRAYETRLKKTEPEWTITNGARGVTVALEEDDNGRNIVFGYGTNPDGGYWQNTKYPRNGQVTRLPLAADPRTQLWLYDDNGNITGENPAFDGNVPPREANVGMDQNTKDIGIRAAQQIVDRESLPSFVGTIRLKTDPREGWRGFIQEGDKLTLIGYQGRDLVLHISGVEVDLSSPTRPVVLTVDERSRDAMTVAQIRTRNQDARRDPALRARNPNRRGRLEVDQIVPFDSESPAGRIEDEDGDPLVVEGGRWNVFSIPFAKAGRIQKVHLEMGSPMVAGFFSYRPPVAVLNLRVGNPHTNDDPFEWFMADPDDTYGFKAGWGQKDQRMGYSPLAETASGFVKAGPFTGKFDEATGFDYVAQANARLYFAVYTVADTTVTGRCYPALVV